MEKSSKKEINFTQRTNAQSVSAKKDLMVRWQHHFAKDKSVENSYQKASSLKNIAHQFITIETTIKQNFVVPILTSAVSIFIY